MNNTHQYESYEERRKFPRIRIDIPMQIQYDKTKFVHTRIYDISPDGIQFRCDQKTAQLLHPSGKLIEEDKKPSVIVIFTVPYKKVKKEIIVRCQILYFTLLSGKHIENENIAFGLKFNKFEGNSGKYAGWFIYNEMKPE